MINTSVNISGKLPSGLIELYRDMTDVAKGLEIPVLVVGAMARDLVLVHGYGARIERGTRDVDFGVNVPGWEEFHRLKSELQRVGFTEVSRMPHRLERISSDGFPWDVDIVPFGGIANPQNQIHWPPDDDFVMSVLGFLEVEQNALRVQICDDPAVILQVASPAGLVLLKLVSWSEREVLKRGKDASDIKYVIASYSKIPMVHEALFDEGYMEARDWDVEEASAMKLGEEIAEMAADDTAVFLADNLLGQPDRRARLAREAARPGEDSADFERLFSVLLDAFSGRISIGSSHR